MITVLIPDRGITGYTLYAAGKNLSRPLHVPDDGGFHIAFEGTVMLFYTFDGAKRKHRKAYVVSETGDGHEIELECVDRPLHFVYMAEGRKVDLLKRLMHYIGSDKDVFTFSPQFWRSVTALIDRNFNGKESELSKPRYMKLREDEITRNALSARQKEPEFSFPERSGCPPFLTFIRSLQ